VRGAFSFLGAVRMSATLPLTRLRAYAEVEETACGSPFAQRQAGQKAVKLRARPFVGVLVSTLGISALGCAKPAPQPKMSAPQELEAGRDGAKRFEIRCISRAKCEERARRVCPTGFEVEREWFDDGLDGTGPVVDQAPAGTTLEKPRTGWGEQPHRGLAIQCTRTPP
jgi:hypothetical protein